MTLGEILHTARRRMGKTQNEIAKAAGVHRNTIIAIEHGDLHVRISSIIAVCNALGVEIGINLKPKDGGK